MTGHDENDGQELPEEGDRPQPLSDGESEAAVLAHEMRGPLAVVSGYLDLLARAEDPETRRYALGAAQRAVARMDALIDDVLSSFAPSTQSGPLQLVDPVAIVQTEIEALTASSSSNSRRVVFDAACASPALGQELQLARAVSNVLDNALKFSPADSTVHVLIERRDEFVAIAVEDEGPGIPLDDARSLLARFRRLGRDKSLPGYGIGLSVAARSLEAMGGALVIGARTDGVGTRVELLLRPAPESPLIA